MNRTRFKMAIWLLIALGMLAAALFTVRQIGELLAYFQDGADPASALNIEPNKPLDWPIDISWREDSHSEGRPLEPLTRTQIESAYVRAWLQWHFSYAKQAPFGLGTYFTGPALEAIETSIERSAEQALSVNQTDTRHDLELTYYSADGTIVAFTDHNASVMRMVNNAAGELVFSAESDSVYDIVMVLDEGRWRIRHLLRVDSAEPMAATASSAQLAPMAGINYYPQATPWHLFWPEFDADVVTADFARMKLLGLNSTRIFIPYEQFGADQVDEAMLGDVETLLDIAAQHNMGVVVTLFDFRADYALWRWNHANAHLATVVNALKTHPALLAWDIKNEPDRDYATNGQALVDAWLAHAIAQTRRHDPDTPITIGWSLPEPAATLASEVDFVSFHYYAPADEFVAAYQSLRNRVGDARPIVLTEFGLPTWNSYFFPNGHSEQEQAAYYADMRSAMAQTDLNGYLAWTLYDFTAVPNDVAGRWPWQKGPQRQLGVYDADGQPKLAATLLAPQADYDDVAGVGVFGRFTKPFWRTVISVALFTAFATHRWWNRRQTE